MGKGTFSVEKWVWGFPKHKCYDEFISYFLQKVCSKQQGLCRGLLALSERNLGKMLHPRMELGVGEQGRCCGTESHEVMPVTQRTSHGW